ncbi:MAG: helix-turn-helix domain-containing protein [Bacteroidales bacterium]|nr:helix-turn-helix domain-containing protein [Bacteroidales bacterium]
MNQKEMENKDLHSLDELLDQRYGAVGTESRAEFDRQSELFYFGQIIRESRKKEKMTQSQLAALVGTTKSYISRIEKGLIEPGITLFVRILNALGLRMEITTPICYT